MKKADNYNISWKSWSDGEDNEQWRRWEKWKMTMDNMKKAEKIMAEKRCNGQKMKKKTTKIYGWQWKCNEK